MKKKLNKKYPFPYVSEEQAKSDECNADFTFTDHTWYTDKGTKITIERRRIAKKLNKKIIHKITVKEEIYVIDGEKNKTLSDTFELYPISQIKDLGSFRIILLKENDKVMISLPSLGNKSFGLDKQQLSLFEAIYECKDHIKINELMKITGYKNQETLRKVIGKLNSKFESLIDNKKERVIKGEQRKGYTINSKFRIIKDEK